MDVVAITEFKRSGMQRGWPGREGSRNKPVCEWIFYNIFGSKKKNKKIFLGLAVGPLGLAVCQASTIIGEVLGGKCGLRIIPEEKPHSTQNLK